MKKKLSYILVCSAVIVVAVSCYSIFKNGNGKFEVDKNLTYCNKQIKRTLYEIENDSCKLPRSIGIDATKWNKTDAYDWTSGFWTGILWYDYENTNDEFIKRKAMQYTDCLETLLNPGHNGDHDLGFQFFCSYGNAYRLTGDEKYKQILLKGAQKLAGFYNPKVGTILSWSHMKDEKGWPHNTIMDNMMNLELLFWTSKNGGDSAFYHMAERHARVTMENQFNEEYINFHVAIYDTISGNLIKRITNQGYNDNSFWARGQAWAIYGYTMAYRETGNKDFLDFAEKVTDIYLKRLPEDYVPFWDFDDPAIPNAPKDASAAAITASALLELSELEGKSHKAKEYRQAAEKMLENLSSDKYQCGDAKPAFLLHSTGNLPGGYEIDASINYADYYYIEALTRYKRFKNGENVVPQF